MSSHVTSRRKDSNNKTQTPRRPYTYFHLIISKKQNESFLS